MMKFSQDAMHAPLPTITLITATYNSAQTVAASLDSIRAQQYPGLESLVMDGASTDGTQALIRQSFGDVVSALHSEPDAGIYDALNKGFRAAQGEVIGLLHSDDTLANPGVLKAVGQLFQDPSVDAVYGNLNYVRREAPHQVVRHWRSQPFTPDLLRRGWMPPHPTLFLRRRVLAQAGEFDTRYRIAADYEHVLRVFTLPGLQARYLPEVMVNMKTGGASNRSLGNIMRKSAEDLRAIRQHGVGGWPTLLSKNFSKLQQIRISTRLQQASPHE